MVWVSGVGTISHYRSNANQLSYLAFYRLKSAKGANARRHLRRNTPLPFRWPLDTATVLRALLKSNCRIAII